MSKIFSNWSQTSGRIFISDLLSQITGVQGNMYLMI